MPIIEQRARRWVGRRRDRRHGRLDGRVHCGRVRVIAGISRVYDFVVCARCVRSLVVGQREANATGGRRLCFAPDDTKRNGVGRTDGRQSKRRTINDRNTYSAQLLQLFLRRTRCMRRRVDPQATRLNSRAP